MNNLDLWAESLKERIRNTFLPMGKYWKSLVQESILWQKANEQFQDNVPVRDSAETLERHIYGL